jgi:hypothetical protein
MEIKQKIIDLSFSAVMNYLVLSDRLHKNAIAHLVKKYWVNNGDLSYYKHFEYWEENGFHITPNHFYQPIPDTRSLTKKSFRRKYSLENINLSPGRQQDLLRKFRRYDSELRRIPNKPLKENSGFHFNNYAFDGLDASVYYSMIREFKPKTIIEAGSGWSTRIASLAIEENSQHKTELISIEPYPLYFLKSIPNLTKLIKKKVEKIDIKEIDKLTKNDIFFIDTSHVVRTGGDVNFLILEILPKIKKGVLIHIHDIFIPSEYPEQWVKKEHRFWTEQYLVYAFLMYNKSFEVIMANSYLSEEEESEVKSTFTAPSRPAGGASLWLRKV